MPFGLEGFDDALSGDCAYKGTAANNGEDVLQCVDTALKCLFEGVGGGEHGKVGEHDVAHAQWISLRVEQEAGVVHMGTDEDEPADHDEPHVGQDAACDGEDEADDLAESGSGSCALHDAVAAGELATEDAASVERSGGEEIDGSE